MIVRPAVPADLDDILALFDAVAEERVFIGTEPGYDRERKRRGLAETIAHPRRLLLVARDDAGKLAGHLAIYEREELGHELGMMVEAAQRGRGVGSALLDAAVAWARSNGLTALHLFVFPHNERALALYRGAGFVEIERYERDVTRRSGEVWDTILMRKEL